MPAVPIAVIAVAVAALFAPVEACTLCSSPTSEQVRDGLLAAGIDRILAALMGPFVVLVAGLRIYTVGCSRLFTETRGSK